MTDINKLEKTFNIMERASELDLKRAKLMKESLKTKDTALLLEGMRQILKEMDELKHEAEEFVNQQEFPPLGEEKMEIPKEEFSKLFSMN